MVLDDEKQKEHPHISVYGQAEMLTCSICGREYVSRGRYDPGICRDCEREQAAADAPLLGGPLGK